MQNHNIAALFQVWKTGTQQFISYFPEFLGTLLYSSVQTSNNLWTLCPTPLSWLCQQFSPHKDVDYEF